MSKHSLEYIKTFLEEHAPQEEQVSISKPFPESTLHEMTFDELTTKLYEARSRQHSLKQFSAEETAHFAFVDEAVAILEYKKLDEYLDKSRFGDYEMHASASAKTMGDTRKFQLKDKKSGKVLSVHGNSLEAVRALKKIGGSSATHSIVKEGLDEAAPKPKKGSLAWEIEQRRKAQSRNPDEIKRIEKIGNSNHTIGNAKVLHKEDLDEKVVSIENDKSGNVLSAKTIPDAEAPFDYNEWKKSSVKPRAMPGWGKNGPITKMVAAQKAVKEDVESLDESPILYKDKEEAKQVASSLARKHNDPHYGFSTTKKGFRVWHTYYDDMKVRGKIRELKESEMVALDELDKSTLGSYIKKASKSAAGLATTAMHHMNTANDWAQLQDKDGRSKQSKEAKKKSNEFGHYSHQATQKQMKRIAGVSKAADRLMKESNRFEEAFMDCVFEELAHDMGIKVASMIVAESEFVAMVINEARGIKEVKADMERVREEYEAKMATLKAEAERIRSQRGFVAKPKSDAGYTDAGRSRAPKNGNW